MDRLGNMEDQGIPASVVAKYLDQQGIIVEKTGPYNLLFLFSIGINKTKALRLMRALNDFKRDYDRNLHVKEMLPSVYHQQPAFYGNMRIQVLANGIHALIRQHRLPELMFNAFETLPTMVMNPHHYPGFETDIHGAYRQPDGRYTVKVIKNLR